jgi:hypothetical protein
MLLINEFDVDGADADEVLGYDGDGDGDGGDGDDGDNDNDDEGEGEKGETSEEDEECSGDEGSRAKPREGFRAFQTRVRVDAAKRAEGNRRAGGLRTQRAMVRAWEACFHSPLATLEFKTDL